MATFGREEAEQLAATVASVDADSPENFFALVARRLESEGVKLPSVLIEYNLRCVVNATSSASALPSLPNVAKAIFKTLTFQRPKVEPLTILNDISGSLKPGCLTLLLGPPSCGKTTFLRALAGRLDPKEYTGYVKYNGTNVTDFDASRSAVFVAQTDSHIPNLTARETVKFAYDIQKGDSGTAFSSTKPKAASGKKVSEEPLSKVITDSSKRSLASMSPSDLENLERDALNGPARVDTLMELFALLRCKDTFVGNVEMRGLSGGERKRLSTVELLTGQQRVLVLDEISTGLDAATLYRIIKWLRAMTHHLKLTVIVSLLQPPPETFALFDDLMLMNEGHIVCHGPVSHAVSFMKSIGFELPARKDVPSFLQEVTTVRGQIMYASPALRAARSIPLSVHEVDDIELSQMSLFIPLTEFSKQCNSALDRSAASESLGGPGDGALIPKSEKRSLSFMQQLALVLGRQRTLFLRDPTLLRARIGQSIFLGLLIGGLWFQLDVSLTDSRTFMSSTFMTTLFFSFGGMPQMSVALNNRNVWFKQRESSMYSATVYAWSQSLVQLPVSIIEAFLFCSITYFMIGFSLDSPQYFFAFVLVNLTTSLAVTSLFRLIGSSFRSLTSAQGFGGFLLLLLIINSGFIIVRSAIPPWIVYFYWVSPFAYGIRGLVVNEFTSPRWDTMSPIPGKSLGDVALESLDFYTDRYWVWVAVAFNFGLFVVLTQLAAVFLAIAKAPRRGATTRSKEEIVETLQQAKNMRAQAQTLLCESHTAQNGTTAKGDLEEAKAPPTASSSMRRGTSSLGVGSALKFTPITVCWRNLSYYVTVPKGLKGAAALNIMPADAPEDIAGKKRLLNDITGYAVPGTLCALMGGTGAGKTTLMDVLAGRKTQGVIKGDLMINGHPKQQDTWARVVGYVEQTDVHSASLTVLESLQFSAGLRLTDDVDARLRQAYILEVLLVTELLDIKGALVGVPGESGLSVEQRRRLSIGVELVANPSVMFMDEPTSGLDARSAGAVIEAVRNVAANGRTVMVTIHQPSIEIFEAFDRLVLLAQGGEPIFCGSIGHHSSCLISYFEGVPGVSPLPEGYNPATWMLEVSGGASEKTSTAVSAEQFPERYRSSDLLAETKARVDELISSGSSNHAPLSLATRYAVPFWQQTKMVTWKMFIVYWRYPEYTVSRLLISIITALIFGLTWWNEGTVDESSAFTDVRRVQNIIGMLYAGLSFMGMGNLISGMPAFFAERQVMYRERSSSMYAVLPFGIATGVVEIPYLIVQSLIFIPIIYSMIGFRASADAVILFFVIYTQSLALYTFMGQFFAYLAPTMPLATVLGGLNHFIWNIFNGFLVPNPAMARGWLWLNFISATTWVIRALAASQLGLDDHPLVVPGQADWPMCSQSNIAACPTVREYLKTAFGYEYSFRWWCALILLVFVLVFRIGAMLVLKAVRHETR